MYYVRKPSPAKFATGALKQPNAEQELPGWRDGTFISLGVPFYTASGEGSPEPCPQNRETWALPDAGNLNMPTVVRTRWTAAHCSYNIVVSFTYLVAPLMLTPTSLVNPLGYPARGSAPSQINSYRRKTHVHILFLIPKATDPFNFLKPARARISLWVSQYLQSHTLLHHINLSNSRVKTGYCKTEFLSHPERYTYVRSASESNPSDLTILPTQSTKAPTANLEELPYITACSQPTYIPNPRRPTHTNNTPPNPPAESTQSTINNQNKRPTTREHTPRSTRTDQPVQPH
ncbi:hypothetical protein DFP72DRAFT_1047375 [Ephemerocybe angulata]|uniref:Uncharacterized protein n=1 Tax=Ephemerocybe angulata TaxID=980116 RepID=A0A8H6HUF8_9AGAR|nr:hypothetical protein DFP72DRAFT_1047375 [Tulosesus angulatus]